MKKINVIIAAIVMLIAGSANADAQLLRFGLKAGMTVSEMHFNQSVFDSSNRTGFTGGAMLEVNMPIGLSVDASVMYVNRNTKISYEGESADNNRSYIDIPLNLKWYISIPVISNVVKPYLATGPSFSFLTGKKHFEDACDNKSFDTAWNFGFGLQLMKHVQVGASYGLGLTKALKATDVTGSGEVTGRNRSWTITAAYLF